MFAIIAHIGAGLYQNNIHIFLVLYIAWIGAMWTLIRQYQYKKAASKKRSVKTVQLHSDL